MSASIYDNDEAEVEVSPDMIQAALQAVWNRAPDFVTKDGYHLSDDLLRLVFVTMYKTRPKSKI